MADGEEDDENATGGRPPTVSDDQILDVFRKTSEPVLTATEVANELSMSRRAIFDRLRNLENEGTLKSKKVTARGTVWWYPGHTSTT